MIALSCVNEVIEEVQAIPDKSEINLNVDLKVSSNVKGMDKDVLDIQMKRVDISLLKGNVQLRNQKTDLDNFLLLYVQKRSVKVLMDFTRTD